MDRVDWVLVVRGASTGFTVLVISGLVNPIVSNINPLAGLIFLVVGAVAASVVAAWRTRTADSPVLSGAVAALISYTLVVPLIYLSERHLDYRVIVLFAAVALLVGTVSGFLLSRGRAGQVK
ncbi:MAG: hypothetical protein QOI50_2652 [Pseudonocardiales bacterium]|jgi:hypothetical protein|uniref:hypothetical protein n=1 Tax=Pseudonocardia sp. Cha107L01 TaxID=3457576 RepID=UPI0028C7D3E9|nr:hypothetical protein [Pseudonocardiales bacterium]MDT7563828.1 hypothetical protein [Pseudonocardiales bacterium]MDT7582800.1 hypothetical protein [Pseudonocardiales bacterium]MDT7619858.1 hypothetical protein [Pseudonocardiales bacterium]MDT7630722.1 hypothetical protein [Pseudonocardiales bacterium]